MSFANIGSAEAQIAAYAWKSSQPLNLNSVAVPALGANRIGLLIVTKQQAAGLPPGNLAATWNGVAMTLCVNYIQTDNYGSIIWRLPECAHNGTYNFQATCDDATGVSAEWQVVAVWFDATGTITFRSGSTASSSGVTAAGTPPLDYIYQIVTADTPPSGSLIISASASAANAQGNPIVDGCTLLQEWDSGGNCSQAAYSTAGGSGAVTHTHNYSQDAQASAASIIAFEEAAGGTEYPLSVSGAVTPSGSLTRQASKALAGGIVPSGMVVRSTAKGFSAGIAPVGSIAKSTAKNLSGAITPTGALSIIKTILLALAGVITPAGSLIRQTAKGFSGSIASVGTVIKSTAKSMAGVITPAGALSVIKTFLLSISGAITPAGELVKSTGKALAGSIASSGTLVKSVARSLTGGITPSGALSIGRIYQLSLAGTIALSGIVTKAIGKTFSGSIALSGSIGKSIGKVLAGVLGLVGSVIVALTGERRFDLTTTVSKSYVLTSSATEAYVLRTSIAQPYTLTVSVSTRG